MLDIRFAYSSNGDAFAEYDFKTGSERELPLAAFPSPDELLARLREDGRTAAQEELLAQPFYTAEGTYPPR